MRRSSPLSLLLVVAALAFPALAGATQPLPDDPDPGVWATNSPAYAVATHGDTTYVGGSFDYVGPPTGAAVALGADGAAQPLGPVTGHITAALADGAGGTYLAGDLRPPDGTRVQLAHVLEGGTLDPGFSAPAFSGASFATVRALALDGTSLYVGGLFGKAGAADRTGVAAVDAHDGHVLPFSVKLEGGGSDGPEVRALAIDGGYLYAGGAFDTANGAACANLIDVSLASHQIFNGLCSYSPAGRVDALAVQDGKLYVGGWYSALGPSAGGMLRRLATATDIPDGNWLPAPDSAVTALATTASAVYLGGPFGFVGNKPRSRAAAVATADAGVLPWQPQPSGTLYNGGSASVDALLVAGGHVYAGGNFTAIGGHGRTDIAELDLATGSATGWNPSIGGQVRALAPGADGKLVAGGSFNSTGGVIRHKLAALGPDGKATAWNPGADAPVAALTPSPDGSIVYVGGEFTQAGGAARSHIAAISAATGSPTDFDPAPDKRVWQLLPAPDGATLYAVGAFKTIGQSSAFDRPYVAALSTAGGDPSSWRPAPDSFVYDLAPAPDWGLLYAGGAFTHIGSQQVQPARAGAAALTRADGTATDWAPVVAGGAVEALLPMPDKVLAGGGFSSVAGQPQQAIAAFGLAGAALPWAAPFGGGSGTRAIAAVGSDRVVLGGQLYTGRWRGLVEAAADTGALTAWDPQLYGGVDSLATDGRKLWVAGAYEAAGGRGNLMRFTRPADPAGPADQPDPGAPGTGPVGGGEPAPVPPPSRADDTTAPSLTGVSLSRSRFRVARRATATVAAARAGTTLRLALSEAAHVRIALRRVRSGRLVRAGTLLRSEPAGPQRLAFSGRVGRRALRPGRYRMRITATDAAGNRSRRAGVRFRIVRAA